MKLPMLFVAGAGVLLFTAAAAPAPTPTRTRVEFTVHNTLDNRVYFNYGQGYEHDINPHNSGKFSMFVPVTIHFREAGKLPQINCGSITVTKQPTHDFYIKRAGERGCEITNP